MKKLLIRLMLSTASFGLTSCGSETLNSPSVIRAEVLQMAPLLESDSPSTPLKFFYGPATLSTLKNVEQLSGDYFKVYRSILKAKPTSQDGEVAKITQQITSPPNPRYKWVDGVLVPQDHSTLLMFSGYYQFEQVALSFETMTGISIQEMIQERGPITIHFHPKIEFETNGSSGKQVGKLNAAFDPDSFSFLLFRDSQGEDIPIGANLSVIAHEFGHLTLDWLLQDVGKTLFDHEDYRGLHEGFSDYFSYVLTGNSSPLLSSIGWIQTQGHPLANERDFVQFNYNYQDYLADQKMITNPLAIPEKINSGLKCHHSFYCLGTVFAKSLYEAQKSLYPHGNRAEDRFAFMKLLVQGIKGARVQIGINKVTQGNPEALGLFFNALITQIHHQETRRAIFDSIVHRFGPLGFQAKHRAGLL